MVGQDPTPQTSLLILLGASSWPLAELPGSTAFENAVMNLQSYFLYDPNGFHLPESNVLNLFNSNDSGPDILNQISDFLRDRITKKETNADVRDVLVYFVGHGGLTTDSSIFYLAIRRTRKDYEKATSIAIDDLAERLKKGVRFQRRILILDCCFAARAVKFLQGPAPAVLLREKTITALEEKDRGVGFPSRGTSFLASSGKDIASIILPDETSTMFTSALLSVLRTGDPFQNTEQLSFRTVHRLTIDFLIKTYGDNFPWPELHSPDQTEGDIANILFFPNPPVEQERVRKAEEESVRKAQEGKAIWKTEEERARKVPNIPLYHLRTEPSYEEQVRKAQEREEMARRAKEAEMRLKAEQERVRKAQEEEAARKAEEEEAVRKAEEEQAYQAEAERIHRAKEAKQARKERMQRIEEEREIKAREEQALRDEEEKSRLIKETSPHQEIEEYVPPEVFLPQGTTPLENEPMAITPSWVAGVQTVKSSLSAPIDGADVLRRVRDRMRPPTWEEFSLPGIGSFTWKSYGVAVFIVSLFAFLWVNPFFLALKVFPDSLEWVLWVPPAILGYFVVPAYIRKRRKSFVLVLMPYGFVYGRRSQKQPSLVVNFQEVTAMSALFPKDVMGMISSTGLTWAFAKQLWRLGAFPHGFLNTVLLITLRTGTRETSTIAQKMYYPKELILLIIHYYEWFKANSFRLDRNTLDTVWPS